MDSRNIAIKAEKISKCYRIGLKEEMHETIAKSIFSFVKSPLKNYRKYRSLYRFDDINNNSVSNSGSNASNLFWALKDVSIEIKQGETVGIIGRNGAGKSTLLKIFSRITRPTKGYAEFRGRISSLLEVGTGFHPELTGRENIYLNGTILGMRKWELDEKFDKIVEFSGVEKFIDTPVKRYSSGMKVRLAFSVAAHLDPEILIVDEVLAVGDADFQKKCINKMQDVGKRGHTVVFVSHNMQAVTRLCDRAILLDGGKIVQDGPSHQVVSAYLYSGRKTTAERVWPDISKAPGDDVARLLAVRVKTEDGHINEAVDIRKPIRIEMEFEVIKSGYKLLPHFNVFNGEGVKVFVTVDQDPAWQSCPRPLGRYVSIVWIPGNFLAEGIHFINPCLATLNPVTNQFAEYDSVSFNVIDSIDGDSARGDWAGEMRGAVRPLLKWTTQFSPKYSEKI